ncbi:MAG: hypothetical protein UZ21_OP11001001096 [Microgenomates bacterium OLB22]|nr:MAG: hypothetical protein UZ21_OP11001001096 [Microgenomates bacterium OLB22]
MEQDKTFPLEFSPGDHDLEAFLTRRHNIIAELSMMNRNGLSSEQIAYYSRESIGTLIDEHVLGVAYPSVSGRITRDGCMELQGIDMTASFRRVKEGSQPGSRYWCESEGYLRVANLLLQPDVSAVYLASPKIEGLDRRMSMLLIREDSPQDDGSYGFRQQCITHADTRESSRDAQEEFLRIAELAKVPFIGCPTTTDLLKSPIPLDSEVLADAYECLGLRDIDIDTSRELQSLLRSNLEEDLDIYAKTMAWAAKYLQTYHEVPKSLYDDLSKKRRNLVRKAAQLFQVPVTSSSFDTSNYDPDLCPFLSDRSEYIVSSLRHGDMPSKALSELRYQECQRCPSCGTVDVRAIIYDGYIQCPHCLDKKPYAC